MRCRERSFKDIQRYGDIFAQRWCVVCRETRKRRVTEWLRYGNAIAVTGPNIAVAARLFPRPPPPPLFSHSLPPFLMAAITQFSMPPATADLATTWAFLEEGVDHIMTKLHTGVSYTKYMNLYTVSYNYCTSSKMHSTTSSEQSVAGRCLSPLHFPSPLC